MEVKAEISRIKFFREYAVHTATQAKKKKKKKSKQTLLEIIRKGLQSDLGKRTIP